MNILNNDDSNRVVGLFDNEREVELTITQLQELGLNQDAEFEVIDKDRLASKIPLQGSQPDTQSSQRSVGRGTFVGPAGVTRSDLLETPTVESRAKERLIHLGIDEKEATFFARHIARHSTVVVVQAGSPVQADEVTRLMQGPNARVSRS